jgi:hypothetical protein
LSVTFVSMNCPAGEVSRLNEVWVLSRFGFEIRYDDSRYAGKPVNGLLTLRGCSKSLFRRLVAEARDTEIRVGGL